MTSALSTPLIGGAAQLDDGRESHDSVSPSRERSVLPPDAKAARRELFRPPSWLMVCGVVLLLMSVSLTAWYGTQNRPEMFDALCASLLTMVGVVPGFASVLFVDRPSRTDRGAAVFQAWQLCALPDAGRLCPGCGDRRPVGRRRPAGGVAR